MSVDDIIKPSKTFFDQIAEAAKTDSISPKKPRGRPPSAKTKAIKKKKATEEFAESFENIAEYRPEPQRMISALALPEGEQLQALEAAMTPRQLAFCREYVIDYSGINAAKRAGYSQSTASQAAVNLMRYRGIRKLIDIYNSSTVRQATKIDPDYIIDKVVAIVNTADKDGDKLRGLELLARHLGMFVDRTEITGKDGGAIQMEETRKQADEVARKLRSMSTRGNLKVVE